MSEGFDWGFGGELDPGLRESGVTMARFYVPIFFDWSETTMDLDAEQKGHLIDAIVDYASKKRELDEITEDLSLVERVAFRFVKGQVDRNDDISAARSKAGSSKSEQTETKDNKPKQTETKENKTEQKRFVPPTVQEVAEYCKERGNSVSPERFVDFYTAKGWKVGNQSMKDWKAAVRTWEQSEKKGFAGKGPSRIVTAQNYSQRDYDDVQESPEEMLRRLQQEAVGN